MKFTKSVIALALMVSLTNCSKEDNNRPVTGDTDLEYTKVGSVTGITMELNGYDFPSAEALVISNDDGLVTYRVAIDFTGHPDSSWVIPLVKEYLPDYINDQNQVGGDLEFVMTSEGIQESWRFGELFTIGKYADPIGTEYLLTLENGSTYKRTIVDKSVDDDYSVGFMLIKVTEIEELAEVSDQIVEKANYYMNHKFGLVGVKLKLRSGEEGQMNFFPPNL